MTVLRRLLCRWFGASCPVDGQLAAHAIRAEMQHQTRKAEAEHGILLHARENAVESAYLYRRLSGENGARDE